MESGHFFSGCKLALASFLLVSLIGCGTLTGIPSHGGGKRFAIEQRLVSTTVRGAIKQIDLSSLRGKTVFLQLTSINDQGAGNMIGGRASMIFAMQGITESSPVTSVKNTFKVFDLSSSANTSTNQRTQGGSRTSSSNSSTSSTTTSADTNSSTNSTGSRDTSENGTNTSTSSGSSTGNSTTNINNTTNGSGTNTNTTNNTNTSTTNGSGTVTSNGGMNTTTTTGSTVTNQTGTNNNTTNSTNTDTTNGSGTSTSNGSNTNTSTTTGTNTTTNTGTNNGTTNGTNSSTGTESSTGSSSQTGTNTSTATQSTSGRSQANSSNFQNSSVTSNNSSTQQVLAGQAAETTTEKSGSGHSARYGVDYKGQGSYQNYTVPVSDVGILQSIIRTYFYLNDVQVTLDPNNPAIEAIVNINVDVFGSIRSRLDTVIYNKETVKVQTVLEVMAIDFRTKALMMVPQTGSYEASYDEKYAFWIGPLNKRTKRITHGSMEDPMLVSFTDIAQAKLERDRQAMTLPAAQPVQQPAAPRVDQGQVNSVTIQQTLAKWLKSWENQDVAGYLSHYSPSFVPKEGMSLERWRKERTDKLTANQGVQVVIKNAQIKLSPDQTKAMVTFLQEYTSSSFKDTSFKTLELENVAGQWKIIKEQSRSQ